MFYSFMEEVSKRPSMYGIRSVEDISLLLVGYSGALIAHGLVSPISLEDYDVAVEASKNLYDNDKEYGEFFANFGDFVCEKYKLKDVHRSSMWYIRHYSASDEESIETFFYLFYKFRNIEPQAPAWLKAKFDNEINE